ncbi:MAG: PAS domain S-box protein [Gemmatimonadales bacterium]
MPPTTDKLLQEVAELRQDNARLMAALAAMDGGVLNDQGHLRRASDLLYRSVIAAMSEGVMVINRGGVIQACNESAQRILGLDPDAVLGRSLFDPTWQPVKEDGSRFPVDEYPATITLRTGRPCSDVVMGVPRSDGRTAWISLNTQPLTRPEENQPSGVVVSLVDISDRKQAEAALQSQTAYLNELFNSDPEAIVLLDPHDHVLRINPEFTATFGYESAEAVGRAINDLVIPEGHEQEAATYTAQLARGERLNVETVRRRKDGTLINVSILGVPIKMAGGPVATYAIYRDISARKHLESQLLHASKMESIGRLAGGVAHDFNNLLTAILGFTDLGLETISAGDPQRPNFEQIRLAATRAADLTRQLLAFARRQAIEPRTTDLGALVGNMENMLNRLLGEQVELTVRTEPDLWPVRIDPAQLEQVVLNLAVNARDAMESGGRLTIVTSNVRIQPRANDHLKVPSGDYVLLTVSDTGQGMTRETLAHLFEPFYTTKDVGKGTGLGLATCYGVVRQSGGHIQTTSVVGQGTTFRIYLPRSAAAEVDAGPASPQRRMPEGSETILLVEDEAVVRAVSSKILKRLGYEVLEAANGLEAIELLKQNIAAVDLVVTDVIMPRLTGPQVVARLRALRPGLRVLYVSGYSGEMIQGGDGRIDLLQKPFTPAELAQRVRSTLDA